MFARNYNSINIFKLNNNPLNRIKANYMYGQLTAGYFRSPSGTEIISLPFKDENYSMVFVVPQIGNYFFVSGHL